MKLKPCPFCGSKVKHLTKFDVVYCSNVECGLHYENGGGYTREYWNTRPIEDQQAEQNQRLKELLFACYDDVSQAMQAKIDKERKGQ